MVSRRVGGGRPGSDCPRKRETLAQKVSLQLALGRVYARSRGCCTKCLSRLAELLESTPGLTRVGSQLSDYPDVFPGVGRRYNTTTPQPFNWECVVRSDVHRTWL